MKTCEHPAPQNTAETNQPAAHQRATLPTVKPATDVFHDKAGLHLVLDLPGVAEADVDVALENRVLTVSADAGVELPEGKAWLRREIRGRRYQRSLRVSERVDTDKVQARFEHGVLYLDMPFRTETLSRKIPISAG